jgi:hypothetical protein
MFKLREKLYAKSFFASVLLATTAICTTFKAEILEAGHSCLVTQSSLSCTANTTATVTGLSSTAGLAIGMAATGTNVPANTFVAQIVSATSVILSQATTGACSAITFTADAFKLLLIKSSPARTFDGTQTNVGTPGSGSPTAANVGTDEASGTGYTSGGIALTNASPVSTNPTTSAAISFTNTIQWTGATLSVTAAVIYNNSTRLGAAATPLNGRAVSVHDFGGTQSVTAGTLTLTVPTQDGTTGLIRIN